MRLNRTPMTYSSLNVYAHNTWGLLLQKLIIIFQASSSPHIYPFLICTFSSPLYEPLWLKFWPSWVAWLLCLCPMFPFVRLRHKGSTSAIVTAGSSGLVPQTGWSRKLAFLREYSFVELKDDFLPIYLSAPRCFSAFFAVWTCTLGHGSQGKEPLTELFSLEDVSY